MPPQVVVQRVVDRVQIDLEEGVDAWGLDIRIDNANPVTTQGKHRGQVGRDVGFARAAAIGMSGNDFGHGSISKDVLKVQDLYRDRRSLARDCRERK